MFQVGEQGILDIDKARLVIKKLVDKAVIGSSKAHVFIIKGKYKTLRCLM